MKNESAESAIFPLVSFVGDTSEKSALHRYLQEISQFRLLDQEETLQLSKDFQEKNDLEAGRRLVLANLRLVVKISMDFQSYWKNNFLDLIQEGNKGLLLAIRKFDPYRGVKFSFYAAYWIKAYVLKHIMDNWRTIKITTSQAMRKLFFNLNKEKRSLRRQGIEPDTKTLASILHCEEKDVIEMESRLNGYEMSLDTPVSHDSNLRLEDTLPSAEDQNVEDIVNQRILVSKVRRIIAGENGNLDGRERVILSARLLSETPKTLQNLADQFNISRERVRQLESRLLKKMQVLFKQQMPDYAS